MCPLATQQPKDPLPSLLTPGGGRRQGSGGGLIVRLWHALASQVAPLVKNPPANAEDAADVGSMQEDPLEKEVASRSSTLAWSIPRSEEAGGLLSRGHKAAGRRWEPGHDGQGQATELPARCPPKAHAYVSAHSFALSLLKKAAL